MKARILSIVTLLLMAATGAMAQTETLLTTITATAKEQASYSTANVATVSFSYTANGSSAYKDGWGWWGYGWIATVTAAEGYTITKCIFYDDANRTATDSEAPFVVETTEEDKTPRINGTPIDGGNMWSKGIKKIEVYGYVTPTVTLSEATDNSTTLTTYDGQVANVTLTRTLQAGSYNTFAVPFSMTIPSGWTVKELSSASFSEGLLTLNFANASSIEAGKPYLVKVSATTNLSSAPFTGVTVSKDAVPFTSTDVDFIPTLGTTTVTGEVKSILFLGASNKLYNPNAENSSMKGFRAYFQLKGTAASARAFNIDFGDGETTGIISVSGSGLMVNCFDGCYDLQGRCIEGQPTQRSAEGRLYPQGLKKGVYIVNGKKVIK